MDLADGPTSLGVFAIALAVASGALVVLLGLVAAGRVDLSRSIVVHAPLDRAWESIRRFPTLHARHGKARDLCRITEWTLRRGDGERAGTVWRCSGTRDGRPYWADVEIVRIVPGREIAFSLRRDSLGTHRGLSRHLGSLCLDSVDTGATKVTWRLDARLRGPRLILERLRAGSRLRARLLDQGLRSLKVEIDRSAKPAPEAPPEGEMPDLATGASSPVRLPPETTV